MRIETFGPLAQLGVAFTRIDGFYFPFEEGNISRKLLGDTIQTKYVGRALSTLVS